MYKATLYNLVVFVMGILILQSVEIKSGLAFSMWLIIILVAFGWLYSVCLDEPKKDGNSRY